MQHEQYLVGLFQQDILVTHQYFDYMRQAVDLPEKRLQLAVLWDVFNLLYEKKLYKQRDFEMAVDWVHARGYEHPFMLDYICQSMGWDAEVIRKQLLVIAEHPLTKLRAAV
jgi:hypothetical protein